MFTKISVVTNARAHPQACRMPVWLLQGLDTRRYGAFIFPI